MGSSVQLSMWNCFVLAFAITAAIWDARKRKIPRVLTTSGLIVGLVYHGFRHDLLSAFVGCAVGLVIGIALFELGAVGGGDVKLVAALGAMLGFHQWLFAMTVAVVVAAIMALFQVICRRVFLQTLKNMWEIVKNIAANGLTSHPELNVKNPSSVRAPFGIAAAIGTLAALAPPSMYLWVR